MKSLYYWLFLMGITLWLLAIFSYPALLKIRSPLAPYVHLSFSFVCHQKEDRCFFVNGAHLPVCSRCIGIYVGFFLGVVAFPFLKKSLSFKPYHLILSAFPIGVEIIGEKLYIWNDHWIRLLSSITFGFILSYITLESLKRNN